MNVRRTFAAAACAALVSSAAAAAERWEFLLGGSVAGSEAVEETAAGFTGTGSFTFQGARIDTAYEVALDASGAPASYSLALAAPGAKVAIASSVAAGSLTLTVSQNGALAGARAFPLSPSLVVLDNNVFGQYRQLSRLLSPDGPALVKVRMLVPQALTAIALDAARRPGTWRWSAGEAGGAAIRWELSSPAPLLLTAWQDLVSGRILQVEIPSARTILRRAGLTLAAEPGAAAARPPYLATPVETKDATVVAGRYRLGATFTRPGGATGRLPVAVIVGGSGPTDRDGAVGGAAVYRDLAVGLAAKGFAALRFDKRTYAYRGDVAALEPDRMGLAEEYLQDVAAAVRLAAADPWCDPARLSLAGHSQGAWVLPLAVEALGADAGLVKRLVLIAPPGKDLGATLLRQLRFREALYPGEPALGRTIADVEAAFAAWRTTGRMPGPLLGGSASYWESVLAADPIGAAARLPQPMLILRGAKDFQVDASDLADWQRALGAKPGVAFATLENLNHLLVDVPEGPSTGVEYYREGWVAPAAVEAVAAGLAR